MNAIKVLLIILHSSDGVLQDGEVCLPYEEGQNKVEFYYRNDTAMFLFS